MVQNMPNICIQFFDRSKLCLVSGSLKVLYLKKHVGGVRVEKLRLDRRTHPLLNSVSEGLYLVKDLISR
jgi:hypothetical protein